MPISTIATLFGLAPRPVALTPDSSPTPDAEDGLLALVEKLDYAFQPVVNIHNGAVHGFEALLRGVEQIGFPSTHAFFEAAAEAGQLIEVEMALQEKAVARFSKHKDFQTYKLFLNIDLRAVVPPVMDRLRRQLEAVRFPATSLILDVSERQPLPNGMAKGDWLSNQEFKLSLDDFGTGLSGLSQLYFSTPDFLKLDRFFIATLPDDSKKKLFISHVVNLAHLLGVVVIAEGVESEREYLACKAVGCDLIQGFLVQPPVSDIAELKSRYVHIESLSRSERRTKTSDQKIINEQIQVIEPISLDADMLKVFERFRHDKSWTFFPVVDASGEPVGIVHERDLKDYTYSLYGKELIANRTMGRKLNQFLTPCPSADINTKAEKILETFSANPESEGVIIVEDRRYVGFMSARSLLNVINEKNVASARDQNPLTKLPGNSLIHEYVSELLAAPQTHGVLAYFDFDNFKPFNDKYGFRLGDRAILLFAEILKKTLGGEGCFVAHVGGDDFFAGFQGIPFAEAQNKVVQVIATFANDVESFYDDEARRNGYMTATDREGNLRRFPLLGVSAALLDLPVGRQPCSSDQISQLIADAKKGAKYSPDHICAVSPIT
ncbi:bifunctional diguanylate cyclase/phosphodiesterase [Telmatospirillum sp. J64-1]|uniref:bifunctional diguanylate cyclase/phosphodiesterase n=1 Tax=Telmatospirillum sp. J64-1 TaxID=2502183 RepID=UPI00115E9C4F|nr:bifunctional diguanylate cyclase/phosphodiesterase [Telmatospirillum sp. J64-1]